MSKLTWTRERPTQAGWYWWRVGVGQGAQIVELYKSTESLRIVFTNPDEDTLLTEVGGEWAGPIPEPEEGAVGG